MNKELEVRIKSLKEKIKTLKGEIILTEKELANAYLDRFPNGKFILQRVRENSYSYSYHKEKDEEKEKVKLFELWWLPKNDKSKRVALTNSGTHYQKNETSPGSGVFSMGTGSWGYASRYGRKTTQYASLDKLVVAALKFEVPMNLLQVFVNKCQESIPEQDRNVVIM